MKLLVLLLVISVIPKSWQAVNIDIDLVINGEYNNDRLSKDKDNSDQETAINSLKQCKKDQVDNLQINMTDQGTTNNSLKQCANEDQVENLQRIIEDQGTTINSLKQCAKEGQVENLQINMTELESRVTAKIEDQGTTISSLKQCAKEDQVENLQINMTELESRVTAKIQESESRVTAKIQDQGTTINSLKQCAKEDEVENLQRSIKEMEIRLNTKIEGGAIQVPPEKLEDIVQGKRLNVSSVYEFGHFVANKATDADLNSFFHSAHEVTPWWMIDFGEQRTVYRILILSRQDCCTERFLDVEIRLGRTLKDDGDFSSHPLLSYYDGPYNLQEGTLTFTYFSGVTGRYLSIKIVKPGNQYLQLNNVNIFALKI